MHKPFLISLAAVLLGAVYPSDEDPDRSRLADGTVGTAYSFQLTAAGGTRPYTFSDQTGVFSLPTGGCGSGLPPGLVLETSGRIHGTPSQAGCFEVHVAVNRYEFKKELAPFAFLVSGFRETD